MDDLIAAMRSAGVSEEAISEILRRMSPKPRRHCVRLWNTECPGCGRSTMRGDYVCWRCSRLKARSPRRFWHKVRSRSGSLSDDRWLAAGVPLCPLHLEERKED